MSRKFATLKSSETSLSHFTGGNTYEILSESLGYYRSRNNNGVIVELLKRRFENVRTEETVKVQIELAKRLVGKRVYGVDKKRTGVVDSFTIESEYTSDCLASLREAINDYGVGIVVHGKWDNGCPMQMTIRPDWTFESMTGDLNKIKVKVNGHVGEDKGDYYLFGCAKIAKEDLLDAREFLAKTERSSGLYRSVSSVRIGAGEFNLEILKQLNL